MTIDQWIEKYYTPYKNSYSGQIAAAEKALSGIKNSYDYASDPLYKAYAEQFAREGRTSALDAYGDAASAVGGMNSSYALAAAEQAKNYYDSKLADKIPELWELAYDTKLEELDSLKSDEKQAYDRWYDGVQAGYKLWVEEQDRLAAEAKQAQKAATTAAKSSSSSAKTSTSKTTAATKSSSAKTSSGKSYVPKAGEYAYAVTVPTLEDTFAALYGRKKK